MNHPTSFFVKPAPGLKVPIPGPAREYLPDAGMLVPRNGYWIRRVKDGDIVVTDAIASREAEQGGLCSPQRFTQDGDVIVTATPAPAPADKGKKKE